MEWFDQFAMICFAIILGLMVLCLIGIIVFPIIMAISEYKEKKKSKKLRHRFYDDK